MFQLFHKQKDLSIKINIKILKQKKILFIKPTAASDTMSHHLTSEHQCSARRTV